MGLISGPMAAGVLLLDPPHGYWSLFSMYFFSECWVAITTTVVMDLSPEHMKSTLLSVYYFVIAFGGFSPQLVTPLANTVGYSLQSYLRSRGIYGRAGHVST